MLKDFYLHFCFSLTVLELRHVLNDFNFRVCFHILHVLWLSSADDLLYDVEDQSQ